MSRVADPPVLGGAGTDQPRPARSGPAEVLRLVLGVAAVVALGYVAGYGETVLLLLFLVGCIVAHEFGHFIAAKTGRVKVTEFFVGFGPRLWSVRRGETEYGVKGIPLGGYCRIVGMNNLEQGIAPEDEPRTYRSAPLWRRLLIDVAGSSAHFVIALVVLFAMFFWTGDPGYYKSNTSATSPIVQIDALNGVSPAQKAGLQVGDRILAIDGTPFPNYNAMHHYIEARPGQRLDFTVDRHGRILHLFPTPVAANTVKATKGVQLPAGHEGVVGFATSPIAHSGFGASISAAGGAFVSAGAQTFDALGHLVTLHGISNYVHDLSSQKAASTDQNRLTTVVGLPSVLHQASQSGLPSVLWILALINISIGILNLLPLFPLDGARVAVGLYEGVRSIRRPYRVDWARLLPVMYATLAVFAFYALGSMFIDLRNAAS